MLAELNDLGKNLALVKSLGSNSSMKRKRIFEAMGITEKEDNADEVPNTSNEAKTAVIENERRILKMTAQDIMQQLLSLLYRAIPKFQTRCIDPQASSTQAAYKFEFSVCEMKRLIDHIELIPSKLTWADRFRFYYPLEPHLRVGQNWDILDTHFEDYAIWRASNGGAGDRALWNIFQTLQILPKHSPMHKLWETRKAGDQGRKHTCVHFSIMQVVGSLIE